MANEKKRASLTNSLLIIVLALVYVPLLFGSVYAVVAPYWKVNAQQKQSYDKYIAANQNIISSYFDTVHDNAALLMDSKTIRDRLRGLSRTHSLEAKSGLVEPQELYGHIDAPLTYNNISANRIISAITIFTGEKLAYYSLQYKTTEQALFRCMMINNQKKMRFPPRACLPSCRIPADMHIISWTIKIFFGGKNTVQL